MQSVQYKSRNKSSTAQKFRQKGKSNLKMSVGGQLYLFGKGQVKTFGASDLHVQDNTFSHAMLTDPDDIYMLYDMEDVPVHASYQVLESTTVTELNFQVKAVNGFPKSGIILFEHYFTGIGKFYHDSTNDVTGTFPTHVNEGVSSVIINSGTWEFYPQTNKDGPLISIDGVTQFVPGRYIFSGETNNTVASMKRLS